jgi:hypothetical protein
MLTFVVAVMMNGKDMALIKVVERQNQCAGLILPLWLLLRPLPNHVHNVNSQLHIGTVMNVIIWVILRVDVQDVDVIGAMHVSQQVMRTRLSVEEHLAVNVLVLLGVPIATEMT